MRDLSSTVWDTLLIKASSSEADNKPKWTQTCAEKVRQEGRGHSRTTIRVGISGPDQVSSAQGQHSRRANGARPIDLLGPTGTPSAGPNLRRGSILQAGQNEHQENHTEHRVARDTIARSRSTRSNRSRAQVRTSTAHGHGTRATSVSVRFAEDMKIMVKAFLAERGVQANSKVAQRHAERTHTAYGSRSRTTTRALELLVQRVQARLCEGSKQTARTSLAPAQKKRSLTRGDPNISCINFTMSANRKDKARLCGEVSVEMWSGGPQRLNATARSLSHAQAPNDVCTNDCMK